MFGAFDDDKQNFVIYLFIYSFLLSFYIYYNYCLLNILFRFAISKRDSTIQNSADTIRTKQIYLNGNMRSSSDPTAGTQSAILKKLFSRENEDSILSSTLIPKQKHHKQDKKFDTNNNNNNNNGSLKLKSIVEHPVGKITINNQISLNY